MRGAVTTGDFANDLRLAEQRAFDAVRRAYQRLADTPLGVSWALYLARRQAKRNVASWRRTYLAMESRPA